MYVCHPLIIDTHDTFFLLMVSAATIKLVLRPSNCEPMYLCSKAYNLPAEQWAKLVKLVNDDDGDDDDDDDGDDIVV